MHTRGDTTEALQVLQKHFGFKNFREGQQPVIDRLLARKSVLAIFPTGAGKSLCYQLPALMFDGITLVISPLIALMKDQIDFLVSRGVPAARMDSSQSLEESREVNQKLRDRALKILYIAPERLANERFLSTLARLDISLLAIDEAHCISEWGHNFRPDYLKLAPLAQRLKVGRVLALTATATPPVASQIAAAFNIGDDDIIRTGFYRPNLNLMVTPCCGAARDRTLIEHIQKPPRGPTIVYVTLQQTAENIAELLRTKNVDAAAYHAGMDAEERHRVQDEFMAARDKVVVATIAFGMGIDKSNIRAVYHYNLPKTLENYAQEIGRAGRDGQPSTCEMLACADDAVALENFTFGDTPIRDAIAGMLNEIFALGETFDISVSELSITHDTRPLVVETLLTYLQLDGHLASTGPFYTEYKFQPLHPLDEVIAKFDPDRAEFLRKIFRQTRKAKTWSYIDVHAVAKSLDEPRDRVVAAINFLAEQGHLILETAGVRHGFRLLKRPGDPRALTDDLSNRFLARESRDLARLAEVLNFASHQGCKTRKLLEYFGEPLGSDCGHCGWCRHHRPGPLPPPSHQPLGDAERKLVSEIRGENHAALAPPRAFAKFLCGIPSPGLSRAKLTRHPHYGAFSGVPFREVLTLAGGE